LANPLERIRVVLVDTSHPGNIGATARALHTMGLARLTLVRPRQFPHADAVARASGATACAKAGNSASSARHGAHQFAPNSSNSAD
jgi:tRNA (cytidine32/uridine32-2'-O)-methyltransferase